VPEVPQFRASGLNLVIAAIVFWNSTYIADAIADLRATEQSLPDAWLTHHPRSARSTSAGDFL
jgi:TnpA family transposase